MRVDADRGAPRARVHGGLAEAELKRLTRELGSLCDFSVSTNPYGPCPEMLDALHRVAVERYPDATASAAREALGALAGAGADAIVLGNGAADLLWTLARVLCPGDSTALIVEPTFSEFRAARVAQRVPVTEWRARADESFAVDLTGVAVAARAARAHVVYLCSPNSPTGVAVRAHDIASWASAHRELRLVLDESFLSLSDNAADARVAMPDNVIRVRSLTKDHGIPGVRVGYLITEPSLARAIEEERPAWTTSAYAQAAAIAACSSAAFVEDSRKKLATDRAGMRAAIADLGLEVFESIAPYFLFRARDASCLARRLLERHGIVVRDCASFGLADFVRVAARPRADAARLLDAVRAELA